MPRRTIAIDIDDVIADSTESLRMAVNKSVGANLRREHYRVPGEYWGYYERVWAAHGIRDSVNLDELDEEMVADQSHVPLLPGASFALSELTKSFDIAIITSRNPAWEAATLRWLNGHFGNVFTSIHFAASSRNKDAKNKGELCKEVGACVLIDDNVEHCRSALDKGIKAVLFGEYGWHHQAPDGLIRCKDWPAVLEQSSEW